MIAVYKRELRSYLTSMIGYLFIFFILFLTGIYFSAYQLGAAYPRFEYTLSALTFVFLISVPILTMRVLAEERKQKTDQLLLTAPVSIEKIVFGKYFALVTIFAIPMLIMCLYPLLMTNSEQYLWEQHTLRSLDFSFWDVQILQLVCLFPH